MALIQVNFMSKSLMRMVPVQVVLPVDKFSMDGEAQAEERPFQTLYLLHGIFGNYMDWVSGSRIQRWAEEKDLAVVMPSGDNAFYIDRPEYHNNYGEFIGKELVEITRRMFPLSREREDTFIGGLSMGGYGALRNGLKYYDTFGYIASLSGAVHVIDSLKERQEGPLAFANNFFGDPVEAMKGDKNPCVLAERLKEKAAQDDRIRLPKLFMACGTEDFLIGANREARDYFREQGFDVTYYESAGGHEWDFWDRYIQKVIDWLPLKEASRGVNSGNVTN